MDVDQLAWENDTANNPRKWSRLRKTTTLISICMIGFTTTLAASIYAPGHEQVKEDFHVSTTVALLPLSAYSLGLAFGPMISSPLSETFGRKYVYLSTLPLFDVFTLAAGFAPDIATLIVFRFFAGLFAAPGVSVSAATISDFTPPEQRVVALSLYYSIPFTGSVAGPLVGSLVTEARGWRWTMWVILMMAARIAEKTGTQGLQVRPEPVMETIRKFLSSTVTRPMHMILTEPLVGFICLYCGFQFALLYTFVVASPWVFKTVYGFSLSEQGLSALGLVVGCLVAPFVLIFLGIAIRNKDLARCRNQGCPVKPERRLLIALYGSLVLPIGLFWFGWTARASVHWMCPIVGQGVAILGSILIYVPCNFYMMDIYGSKYGASAGGASSLSRYLLSAAFPLFVTQMYEALGIGWASSLLGFLAIVLAPIPWLFYYFGPRLRARSAYEHGT
ncbi:hypothetical protein N7468_003100 [Penicillium chermesinum]|uniref:Major facilitator superfamily (MFS) profile domain-containing protein n=1 Tax=Penicillium chermesinum TaxID=63820 RepID=A0A9W9P6L1_9EURO|nr:uncharacterized protein N7468_003100 [Penicillium chermesinum]KAJ5238481.1 hypothetical protein N7468_003100 [Penicillium chermesinum]